MVADFLEAMAHFEEMAGTRMSQAVWAIAFGWQSNEGQVLSHEVAKGSLRQNTIRGTQGEEQDATWALWPAVPQVACNRITNTRHKGEGLKAQALGSSDADTVVLPIDIVELQASDFARAQAIDSQQQQDGPVAEMGRYIP